MFSFSSSSCTHCSPTKGFTPHFLGAVASAGTKALCASRESAVMPSLQKHRASFKNLSSAQQASVVRTPCGAESFGSHNTGKFSSRSTAHGDSEACPRVDATSAATKTRRSIIDVAARRIIHGRVGGPRRVRVSMRTGSQKRKNCGDEARCSFLAMNAFVFFFSFSISCDEFAACPSF